MTFDEKVAALRDVTPPMQARKRKADCTPSEWAAHLNYHKQRYANRSPAQREKEAQVHRRWKAANRQRVNAASKKWYAAHKGQHRTRCKAWVDRHPGKMAEYCRAYYKRNRDKRLGEVRKWRQSHSDHINAYQKRRRDSSVSVRVRGAMASSINQSLRRALGGKLVRKETTMKLIGCTVQELMRHLESQFLPGMSWDNWGKGTGKWHIDHVFPASKAAVSDPVLTATVFSYVNLRPMWGSDNQSKSNAVRWDEIHNHYMKEVST